jgi:DNA-damage-inducible protein J
MFLRQTILNNGIPFELTLRKQSDITLDAIREGRQIASDNSVPSYTSIDELKIALEE